MLSSINENMSKLLDDQVAFAYIHIYNIHHTLIVRGQEATCSIYCTMWLVGLPLLCSEGEFLKPGLWTVDWTTSWTMDGILD